MKFSTKLPYAIRKITKSSFSMVNFEFKTTEYKINKLQQTKGES